MKNYYWTPILLILIFLNGCHNKEMKQSGNISVPDQEIVNDVKIDPSADMTATGSPYNISNISLSGDVLSISVNYGGGCKEHDFGLLSNGMYSKSLPPQIELCLNHSGNADMCKELVNKELKFNISKLKYANSKTIVIKIGDKQINYSSE